MAHAVQTGTARHARRRRRAYTLINTPARGFGGAQTLVRVAASHRVPTPPRTRPLDGPAEPPCALGGTCGGTWGRRRALTAGQRGRRRRTAPPRRPRDRTPRSSPGSRLVVVAWESLARRGVFAPRCLVASFLWVFLRYLGYILGSIPKAHHFVFVCVVIMTISLTAAGQIKKS